MCVWVSHMYSVSTHNAMLSYRYVVYRMYIFIYIVCVYIYICIYSISYLYIVYINVSIRFGFTFTVLSHSINVLYNE